MLNNALVVDPKYAQTHSLLGSIAWIYESDIGKAAKHFKRAWEINPMATTGVVNLLISLGRTDQAISVARNNAARDPVNAAAHDALALTYLTAGRWDDAIAAAQTILRLSPGRFATHYHIGVALLFKGEPEAALEEFGKESDMSYRLKGQSMALHDLGRENEFRDNLQQLIERVGDLWPSEVAHVYAYIDDVDAAFQWLQTSVADETGGFIPQSPFLASLSNDSRWLPLLEEMDKTPAQLEAIEFEITLPE
jgi:tetratricopeptide (TPR) repeat protein